MPKSRRPARQPVPSSRDTPEAMEVFAAALDLFTDDGTVSKDTGELAVGTHYRETETLAIRLTVSGDAWGLDIVRKADLKTAMAAVLGGASPDAMPVPFRLLAVAAPFDGLTRVVGAFVPGEWQAELLQVVH
jgi:hypothetical protein